MASALLKDGRRQIRKTLNRYLSIVAITALGVAFFAGLRATAPDMRTTAEEYLNRLDFMDVRLLSTAGFNENDLKAIEGLKGIREIMPAYSSDALVRISDESYAVKLQSLSLSDGKVSGVNRPNLTQGRLPRKKNECLADPKFLKLSGCKVGDEVTFTSGSGGSLGDVLNTSRFTIVGVAENPLYISYERGTSSVGNGKVNAYFYIPSEAFCLSVYTEVDITVQNPQNLSIFSDDYDSKLLTPLKNTIKSAAKLRTAARFAEIKKEAQDQLDKAQKKLSDAKKALSDARKKLEDAKTEISAGQKTLNQKKKEFDAQIVSAEKKLKTGEAEYETGVAQLSEKEAEVDKGLSEYRSGEKQLDEAKEQLEAGKAQLASLQQQIALIEEQMQGLSEDSDRYRQLSAELAALNQQYEESSAALEASQAELEQNEAKLAAEKQQLDEAQTEISAAKGKLEDTRATLDASRKKLEKERSAGEKRLNSGQKKLDDAKAQVAKSEKEYEKKKKEAQPGFAKAEKSISDGKKKLAELEKPVWYVLDHNTNEGFLSYKEDADRIAAISVVFPTIFFLVAALVSLTCMTRLVEDQRMYIGTLKALGYPRGTIAAKYLFYAVSASLVGSVLGFLVGFRLFPTVIFNAYRILYTLPPVQAGFQPVYALASTGAAVFSAAVPAYLVCIRSLHETPASLMRPKAPQPGRRILLEKIAPVWKRMNFTAKVTARNLFRYKKRLLMTVTGVAGCTALILTGFGLQDGISAIVDWQYGQIRTYDLQIDLKDGISSKNLESLESLLQNGKSVTGSIAVHQQAVDAYTTGGTKSVFLVVPESGTDFGGFIHLRERVDHRKLTLDGDTAVISEKLALLLNLKTGDTLHIRTSDGIVKDVKVGGVAENYLYHYVYMSSSLYHKLFGGQPEANQFLCTVADRSQAGEDTLSETLLNQAGVSSVSFTTGLRSTFEKMISAVHSVVIILIVSAGLLAFVVLFSLTGINIDERKRELATIKVLGFYDRETGNYIYRENLVLTLIGIVFGLLLGVVMERYVVVSSEVDMVMFGRDVLWQSYFYSAALTACFAVLVNWIMFARIRRIDMVSSLKSIE